MKTLKSICACGLLAAGAMAQAGAQPSGGNINPALLYYQAFLLAPDPMADADDAYLYSKEGLSQPLPERYGKIYAGYDNEFKLVRQAARATVPCDWGIHLSEGPATLLPHLARCKAVAQAARFRVVWSLDHGDQAGARDDLLGSFALARNTSHDGTLISALVQYAAEVLDCATLAKNFGRFTPDTLKQLDEGLNAAPAGRTVADCILAEKAIFQDWLINRIAALQKANPGDDSKVMADIHEVLTGILGPGREDRPMMLHRESDSTNWWAQLTQAAGGTSSGVLRLLQDQTPFYERFAAIQGVPFAQREDPIKQLIAEVRKSPNPFVTLFLPTWEGATHRETRRGVWLAMVHAAVEYKLYGQSGFQSVTDPCGSGPFAFRRFIFERVDRGFELTSVYTGGGFPEKLIFVEKAGPPFRGDGPYVGQAVTK